MYNDNVLLHFIPFETQTKETHGKIATEIANTIWNMNVGRILFDISNGLYGDTKKY